MLRPEMLILICLAGTAALLIGVLRLTRRREPDLARRPRNGTPDRPRPGGLAAQRHGAFEAGTMMSDPLRPICSMLCAWLAESEDEPDVWPAFDQIVRETLMEHLGAARIRCYHVRPGSDTLEPLTKAAREPGLGDSGSRVPPPGSVQQPPKPAVLYPSSRVGLLGHVATSGQEFAAGDPAHGPLLDRLASQRDEAWAWVWPVRCGRATVGLIAVGHLPEERFGNGEPLGPPDGPATESRAESRRGDRRASTLPALPPSLRQPLGQLLSLVWLHVACRQQLHIVRRTDRGSGVLTRNDFFVLAAQGLQDSYQAHEPVVLAVVALEGLRGLDDSGRWSQRDALVECIGQTIARRVRGDDLVGRFADDRFVVLLRRLDSGLGRLIAEKMLASARECVSWLQRSQDARTRGAAADAGALAEPANAPGPGPACGAGPRTAEAEHDVAALEPPDIRIRIGLAGSGFSQPGLETLLVTAFAAADRARRENLSVASDLEGSAS